MLVFLTFLYLDFKIILFFSSQESLWLLQVTEAQEGHRYVLELTPSWSGSITRTESWKAKQVQIMSFLWSHSAPVEDFWLLLLVLSLQQQKQLNELAFSFKYSKVSVIA